MPIYEYECGACGGKHEFIQKFSDGPKRKCPDCGKSRLRKLVSAAAFHLKGAGWYVTDFRDKGAKKDGEADKDKATTASAGDGAKDSSKASESGTTADKPAQTSTEKASGGKASGKKDGDGKKAKTASK